MSVTIGPLPPDDENEAACARMMADSEPWRTLGRDFDACLRVLQRREGRERFAAWDETGTLAGFVILVLTGSTFVGYIQTLCVAPERRGRGIGTALVRFAEKRIFTVSPNAFLCVSSFNEGAIRLYERLGYVRVGKMPDFLTRGHGEILYRKSLGPWDEFRKRD